MKPLPTYALNAENVIAIAILKRRISNILGEIPMSDEVKNMTTDDVKRYLDTHSVEDYNLLDVRQDWEYEELHLPGANLIPLPELPDRLGEIASDKPTLVYCASGGRSAAAANLLVGQGIGDVSNMLGGMRSWKNEHASGPQTLGIIYFSGNESPIEILGIAYAMETNLGTFYSEMSHSTKPELVDSFTQLSKFEKGHKAKVFNLAREFDPSLTSREDMEERSPVSALEGGITAEDFLEANGEYLKTPKGALEAAMMFEAQALDLYMRFALKTENSASIELLHTLAQEEKNHLKMLGKLMERNIVGN